MSDSTPRFTFSNELKREVEKLCDFGDAIAEVIKRTNITVVTPGTAIRDAVLSDNPYAANDILETIPDVVSVDTLHRILDQIGPSTLQHFVKYSYECIILQSRIHEEIMAYFPPT